MRVPFPHALSIGTDIIAVNRLLSSARNSRSRINQQQRLVQRLLHPNEIIKLNERFPNWRITSQQQQQSDDIDQQRESRGLATWLAGRWAAKEAAKKAWGAHLISFRDLRVEQTSSGDVEIICQSFDEQTEHVADTNADVNKSLEQVAKLSISHDGEYAVATVIASPLHSDIVAALQARKVSIKRGDSAASDEDDASIDR